ncbi:hypothetical protein [Stenotrophomonas maltophilia]|uniref:hypothetical protein n=1 Tax=Stenotrophomonas maltophilia TaxID=40324 RepID=UPI0010A9EF55|nr:hypothetical protein [Stenotrophomonas maltophilia]
MIPFERFNEIASDFYDPEFSDRYLARSFALGVSSVGADGREAWVVLRSEVNGTRAVELHLEESHGSPDDELDVSVAVSATFAVWLEIAGGGLPAAVSSADRGDLYISGALPYFIRNVRLLMEMVVLFGVSVESNAIR